MKIAVIGTGYWGPNIVRNLLALGHDVTLYDINKQNLQRTLEQFNKCGYADSLEEILSNGEIKAVAIIVPLIDHCGLIIRCLKAGKDVFVEKSLCLTLKEGEQIRSCLGNRILMVGHTTLYTECIEKIREMLREKKLEKLTGIHASRTHLGRIYPGIDAATEVASHDISIMLYLLNEMPDTVNAWGTSRLKLAGPDNVMIILRFRENLTCTIKVEWSSIIRERKMIIEGTSGSMIYIRVNEKEELTLHDQLKAFESLKKGAYPMEAMKLVRTETIMISCREPLYDELDHFLKCVELQKQPLTDFDFGLKVVRILEGIRTSFDQNGKTVNINA